ncbi:MAG TPA: tRNA (adenosine(37)-N6)-threonylcarbamoyltransferase complex dimerization subunit type 1 TsaB [Catalimonadaceae bacterium]|nr:tRNA (adenosine(37)-N6)-threonylcarbamoyltransferase complex dimerization subunit type 1 TsaB [Catalimonadaceae bacterium]
MPSYNSESCVILSIETSAEFASVSIQRDGFELYGATFYLPQVHANVVAPLIEKSLIFSGLNWSQISAVAIGKGPGSYTGLRIATSVAKGICLARNLPLLSVSSLENIAFQVFMENTEADLALVSLDARRDEIYVALYDRELHPVLNSKAIVLGEIDFEKLTTGKKVVLAGSGSDKTFNFYSGISNWKICPHIYSGAKTVGQLALERAKRQDYEDVILFEPDYLKPVFIQS